MAIIVNLFYVSIIDCFPKVHGSAYTEPIINIKPTEIFFCKGNCSLLTSYTGMITITESMTMLTRQFIRTAVSKSMHFSGCSFIHPSHVKCTGRHRRGSTSAQIKPMAVLTPISVYARQRNVRDWKMRSRKRQTDILASDIWTLYMVAKALKYLGVKKSC